jgi:hypothetical protein
MQDRDKKAFGILYETLMKEQYKRINKGSLDGYEEWLQSCNEMCNVMCDGGDK